MARSEETGQTRKLVVIKKYANRRLYNTSTSSYVTLEHLCHMVKDEVDFVVYDAKTGEDITRSVLTQIIVEEESKGTNLLPIAFLRQLISFYGHSMQGFVPNYLEQMMAAFAANQDRMRQQMQETMSGMFPFGTRLEEMSRQNAALMESAMKMFTPFGPPQEPGAETAGETAPGQAASGSGGETGGSDLGGGSGGRKTAETADTATLATLQQEIRQLQERIDALSSSAAPRQTPESPETEAATSPVADPSTQTAGPAQATGGAPAPATSTGGASTKTRPGQT